jgi:Tfp pilus assembly protein PilO
MKFLKSIPKAKLQQMILAAVVCLTILGAVINFYVLQQFDRLALKGNKVAELSAKISKYENIAKNEANNTELRERMKGFVETQQARMVVGDPFSWAVREISLLAEKHPVRVLGLSPGVKLSYPDKPNYSMFTVRLDVSGNYDQLGRFVCDLENKFPTGYIRSLTLSDADAGKGDCRAAIEMGLMMNSLEFKTTSAVDSPSKKTKT